MTSVEEAHVKLRFPIEILHNTLKCVICLEDFKDPVLTRCEHLFCWECISRILKDRRNPNCPLCKMTVSRRSITRVEYISQMISRFIQLRDSIPKDTGFEIESFLGVPTGAREAPTNSPATKKFSSRTSSRTGVMPHTSDVLVQSEVSVSGLPSSEENVSVPKDVQAIDTEPQNIIPSNGKKFGRCYKRHSSEQSKPEQVVMKLGSDKDSVHSDSDDWDSLYMSKKTNPDAHCSSKTSTGDLEKLKPVPTVQPCGDNNHSSASGHEHAVNNSRCTKAEEKPVECESQFPFNYPTRKGKVKITAFDKLLKDSSIASSQALSEGFKDSYDKKIFTCKVQPDGKVSSEKAGEEKLDDPYLFVSSQHTPHRVKYKKDGVKDLGKVGKPRTRKNILKPKQNKQETKKDAVKESDNGSLLEKGSQNFIESCPVEVNDEFDKLVVEAQKSVAQAQMSSKSFQDSQDDKNDNEDANLAYLFRTPTSESRVAELPGKSETSVLVAKDKKHGRGRSVGSRKTLNLMSTGSVDAKRKPRRAKSLPQCVPSGKDDQPSLSQQVRRIQQQFDDVSSHELSVEQKEATAKRDTNKNILNLINREQQVERSPFQKTSNSVKRVSFADVEMEEQAPAAQDKLSGGCVPLVSIQCDSVHAVDKPESTKTDSSNTCCIGIATETPGTPKGNKLSDPRKDDADSNSYETMHLKPALTFDMVSEGNSSVLSPGEPVLGFVKSPTGDGTQARWRVRTVRHLEMTEVSSSPGLKRKRTDTDEVDDNLVTKVVEDGATTTAVASNLGVEALVDSGAGDDTEVSLHTHGKDPPALEQSMHNSIDAEVSSNIVAEVSHKHAAKKMKECKSYIYESNQHKYSEPDTQRENHCDQQTQTAVETVEVGTEVDLHLTSKPRTKTRTYVEVSVQTDMFDDMQKCQVLRVDAQTSPIRLNAMIAKKSTCIDRQYCEEPENTECVPGTCDEIVEDSAYLAQNFKDLEAAICSQNNLMTEESEQIEFSSFDEDDMSSEVNVSTVFSLESNKQLQQTSIAAAKTDMSSKANPNLASNRSEALSCGKKDFQSHNEKPVQKGITTVEAPDNSLKSSDFSKTKANGKGLLSLASSKMSRKLSFSPNFVPTLSKTAFPMVFESNSSESEEEIRPKIKSAKRSRLLSLSSDSDVEHKVKPSACSRGSGISSAIPSRISVESDNELVVSEVMDLETFQVVGGKSPQSATKQPAQPPSLARVVDVEPVANAARCPENPSALITPSLQALLQNTASENTMEFLEEGASEPTQHSATSTDPIDTQQLRNIDLAIMAANTEQENPRELQRTGEADQAKDDASCMIDDTELVYDDIIEPTPEKTASFVSHRASKTKADVSSSRGLQFADEPQSQAANTTTVVLHKVTDSNVDRRVEAPQRVALEARRELVVGQRPPLQVVTNALPVVSRPGTGQKKPVCIACSMLSAQSKFLVHKLVEFFGLSFSQTYHKGVTHLLVPRTDESIQTVKYVFAVAEKKWVLYEQWVRDSLKARALLSEEDYEVCEPVSEGPRRSRLSTEPLFKNYQMCFVPPLETITLEQIQEVSQLCGAEVVAEPGLLSVKSGRTLLLLIDEKCEDRALELLKKYRLPPVSYFYVIDCISGYKLLDPYAYMITKNVSESTFRQLVYK